MNYKDFENCGLKRALDMVSGKWKPMILHFLFHYGEHRFNDLWGSMPKVSKKVLSEHCKTKVWQNTLTDPQEMFVRRLIALLIALNLS